MNLCALDCILSVLLVLLWQVRAEEVSEKPPTVGGWDTEELHLTSGSTLTLTCPSEANGLSFRWLRDGSRLDVTDRILQISNLTLEDSASYRCSVSNALGGILSLPISVNVLYVLGFTSSSENVIDVLSGSPFVLHPPDFAASSHLNLTWQWYFEDIPVVSDSANYISTFGDLVVLNSRGRFGTYKVEVVANGKKYLSPSQVVTEGADANDGFNFGVFFAPKEATYRVGDEAPVRFDCVPSQWDRVTLRWSLDDLQLKNGENVRITEEDRRLELRFPHLLTRNDEPKVYCTAANANGLSDRVFTRLKVIRSPAVDRKLFARELKKSVGDSLTLRCPASGVPSPLFRWYFNAEPLSVEENVLRLDRLSIDRFGIYQCEASNVAGADMAPVWLKPDYDRVSSDAPSLSTASAVKIVEFPKDASVAVGEELRLSCGAQGSLPVNIEWKFNGSLILPDDRIRITEKKLSVSSTTKLDAGVYSCIASDGVSTDEAAAVVRITGSSLIHYGPTNQSILIGSNILMPCKVSEDYAGSDDVQITWLWQNRTIPASGSAVHRFIIDADNNLSIKQVGPDNIGYYTCRVRLGAREESVSAWLRIIEKPSMPQSLAAELVNDTIPAKVRVSWREGFDGNSPIIKHVVEMRSMGPTGFWSDWEVALDNVPSELCCSALIDNLKPSSTLEFRVVAVNRYGPGKPSLRSNNITMPQQPPAAAPRNVAASARSWSSVMVQWQPPPSEQWNGDILGYIIRYRLANYAGLPWLEKNVSNGHARNAPLEHLITWREYEIQIAAYNHRGMGVFSKPLYVTTLEGVPTQPPHRVKVEVLNSTSIKVSFTAPDQQMIPGVNQGYKVELWKGEVAPSNLFRQIRLLPDEVNVEQVIGGLEKFGHYNVTALCFTSPGDGPRSDPISVVTMEDVPGAVESLRFDTVLFNSAVVAWDPPADQNGIITKYTLHYWEDASPADKKAVDIDPAVRNATIEGLTASTHYTVEMHAETKVGAGPKVEAKFESGVPPELPGRPSALVVSDVGARTAMLQFVPGFDGHTPIRKWIVESKLASSSSFQPVFEISAPKARSFVVEGLRPYTSYQLRLVAENFRGRGAPSEPSRQFETKQAEPEIAPERLFAEPLSATSISIVWTPLHSTQWNGEPRGYLILFRAANQSRQWSEIRASNIKAGDFVLSDLRPYTLYEVQMVAENSLGRSKASETVTATTYESVPSGAPISVQATVDDQRRAVVVWKPVDEELENGVILGYKVRLVPEEERLRGEHTRSEEVTNASLLSVAFSQLRAFTSYRVFVSAFTIVGSGPDNASPPVVHTSEDIPGEPSNVAFSFVSESEVRLKWMPPLVPNGRIEHYEIAYWKPEAKEDTTKVQLPYNIYGFSATGLQKNSRYFFGVSAETRIGWGPQAVVSVVTTNERRPLPSPPVPQRNDAKVQSSTEIFLKWNKPTLPHGEEDVTPVRFVNLEYQTATSEWTQFAHSVPGTRTEAVISGLRPNTGYRVRIRLSSDFGQSGWSLESSWIRTLEAAPSAPPVAVQASPYESSSLLLQWMPPPRSDWNSDLIGYRVVYRIYPSNDTFKSEEVPMTQEERTKVQHVIRKLASFRHYIVQVQAFNQQGSSALSSPVFVYVGYSIPRQKVSTIVAEALSPTSIEVRWEPWAEHPDDVISGFRIRYTPIVPVLSTEENLEEMVVSENNSIILTELRKYTEYQISVSAYNRAGEGEMSAVRQRTLEDRPGAVSDLTFSDILLDSVNVSWSPPLQPNGRIQAYIVNYRTYKLKEEFKKEIQEKTSLTYHLAGNLEENVTYFFSVRAETAAGYGAEVTGNVTVGPNPGCPEPPSKPHLIPGQTSVTLEWQDGKPGTSAIVGHIIQAKRIARANEPFNGADGPERTRRDVDVDVRPQHVIGDWVTLSHVRGDQPRYEIGYRQLEPASLYVFRLFARNALGVGYASPESDQLHVPMSLPEDPFYTKWWFIVMVAMLTFVVIVVVVALLCVTGSRYRYEKRNSVDSLQLADGGIVSYELRVSKRRNVHSRHDLPIRPSTNTSWISDSREPPAYGSIVGVDETGCTSNMYGSLATDVIPPSGRASALVGMGFARPLSASNYVNQDPMLDDFSAEADSVDGGSEPEAEQEPSIAQHYEHEDAYRNTWRRVRAEALAEAAPPVLSALRPPRPASSDSNRSELAMITSSSRNIPGNASVVNGFSSFV